MKKVIIILSTLMLSSKLLVAQILEDSVLVMQYSLPVRQFVEKCDFNSKVTNMTPAMEVHEKKLPKPVSRKGLKRYKLYSKNRNVVFSFKYERDNRIILWLNRDEKHCFILDPRYKFSFISYDLKKDVLEV